MYKIYLLAWENGQSHVLPDSRTTTPEPAAAEAAFRALLRRDDLRGKRMAAMLSLNNTQLMFHRFDRSPGFVDYVDANGPIRLHL